MKVATHRYLTTRELGTRCGVSPRTVEGWRTNGLGPSYTRVGNRVMYKISEVEKWEESAQDRARVALEERAFRYRERLERQARRFA